MVPASLLGVDTVEPVALADAYATFATAGRRPDVHVVGRILAADGTVLYDAASRPALPGRALDPGIAVQVRNAREQGICCGSGTEAALGGDVAQFGQSGTTQGDLAAWFAGSTPDLTTVVWGGLPAQVWRSYTEQATGAGAGFPS